MELVEVDADDVDAACARDGRGGSGRDDEPRGNVAGDAVLRTDIEPFALFADFSAGGLRRFQRFEHRFYIGLPDRPAVAGQFADAKAVFFRTDIRGGGRDRRWWRS